MDFYMRFEKLCAQYPGGPLSPSGLELEKMMKDEGVKSFDRSTAGKWKANQNVPRCNFIIALANIFQTSTNYLLGRTEDITDHSKETPALTEVDNRLLMLCKQLDAEDFQEVLNFVNFKLQNDKYKKAGETA